ncbi:cytochrome P450 [Nocardia australiensis]|uniref:cytochrome P450 n=1 Tax=Nocardia australiensis TaxID=2887191 RepID=UPI001D15D6A7|nr:cytochrome P450 [Nocardia australiensis]
MSFVRPSETPAQDPVVVQGSPVAPDSHALPLYDGEYLADPHGFYQRARQEFGSLVPVDLAPGAPGTLVTAHAEALKILHDRENFPADPRAWQQQVPAQCPVRSATEWRPVPQRSARADHERYRGAVSAALAQVSQHALQATVVRTAVSLINTFCGRGRADLRAEYAVPLTFAAFNQLVGTSGEAGRQVYQGLAASVAATDPAAAQQGYGLVTAALAEVVKHKQSAPAQDVATWLIQQPTGLTEDEVVHQLAALYTAGAEPTASLILNTLGMLLTDQRFTGDVLGGGMGVREQVEEALFLDPPVANGCMRYPTAPRLVGKRWVGAHQPVVISIAACNRDPAVHQAADRLGNRCHLAWGAGVHSCPASDIALLIATAALEQLLDALPVMQLAISADQLSWFPGPFHRALRALPVSFAPAPPLNQ